MATKSLARRSSAPARRAPSRTRAVARRVGASIARGARSAGAAAGARVKENIRNKALMVGALGTVAGAAIEAKVPQLPKVDGVPPQLLIGAVGVGVGMVLKGKVAETAIYAGMGPLFAGISSLSKKFLSGGTLAGEFSGGPYGFGPTSIQGEFDDVV